MGTLTSSGWLGIVAIQLLARAAHAGEPEAATEEVVVTGIRMSVDKSIQEKRDLDVVADTIAAEDVGKFPDHNVAEALQRVTGVQITRDVLTSDFISSLKVYKTPRADLSHPARRRALRYSGSKVHPSAASERRQRLRQGC